MRGHMDLPSRRVLLVHNGADLYGASRSLLRLAQRLDRSRFTPVVLLPEDGPLKARLEEHRVRVLVDRRLSIITRPAFRSWRLLGFLLRFPRSVGSLRRLIRDERIDLVHTNTGVVVSPALAARLAGVPHVWHIREWFGEFGPVWRIYARYILRNSARVIAVSQPIADQFPRSGKVAVVHNGFPLDEFAVDQAALRCEFRERHGLGDGFTAGCVGRIKLVRKGQEVLLRAVAQLAARGIRIKCLLVGAPFPGNEAHLAELRRLTRELKLDGQVVFAGELADAKPAYAAMDVLVLPSAQPEPFGGVVMEAMAMGLPVIATNLGGSVDQVADGVSGFLVPPSDPEALANKLEALSSDRVLCARMGKAGRERLAVNFSIKRMLETIEGIYQETIRGSSR
jgi:glycosyltransferase involved in cell wall biosynthesis